MTLGNGVLTNYYRVIHFLTQEIANYSVAEVNNMHPFEVEIYALLKREQLQREKEARRKIQETM